MIVGLYQGNHKFCEAFQFYEFINYDLYPLEIINCTKPFCSLSLEKSMRCVYIYIRIYTYICVCMYIYTYICVCIYIHIYMHTSIIQILTWLMDSGFTVPLYSVKMPKLHYHHTHSSVQDS